MRLRILELPVGHDPLTNDYRVPFVLVLDDCDLIPRPEEAQQWSTSARGVGAEGLLIFREEIDIEPIRHSGDDWPHYTSTYCIHDQHSRCRIACKVCRAPCRCSCHDTDEPVSEPAAPVLEVSDE